MMFKNLMQAVHLTAVNRGWWDKPRSVGESIALMHSELSEALDADRTGKTSSEHIPEFSGLEEEMADTVIRIMDFCEGNHLRLEEAIIAKNEFNKTRAYRHGKKY